jgi:2-keto-4-pentenoate hydratase/2-oxohepta-3-ene-1,7-dioic acid hydratase in catechol pathway
MPYSELSFVLTLFVLFSLAVSHTNGEQNADGVTKYARFRVGDTVSYGVVDGGRVRRLEGDLFGEWQTTGETYPLADVELLVPSTPTKVIALAGNYRDHLGDTPVPEHPEPFYKVPSCLIPHEANVVLPATTEDVHYEAELVIVIGRRAKDVSADDSLKFVLGVTCGNDISARIWQRGDRQWWRAKGSDTFGPCGPFIVSGIDYNNLDMELRVNGQVRQKTNTKNQIHDVAQTVSFISRHITLEPGDLIYSGTPGQTTALKPGDVVEVEIQNVGVLRNPVISED